MGTPLRNILVVFGKNRNWPLFPHAAFKLQASLFCEATYVSSLRVGFQVCTGYRTYILENLNVHVFFFCTWREFLQKKKNKKSFLNKKKWLKYVAFGNLIFRLP